MDKALRIAQLILSGNLIAGTPLACSRGICLQRQAILNNCGVGYLAYGALFTIKKILGGVTATLRLLPINLPRVGRLSLAERGL